MPTYRITSLDVHADGNLLYEVAFWLGSGASGQPFLVHQFIHKLPVGSKLWAKRDDQGRFLRLDGTVVEPDELVPEDHGATTVTVVGGVPVFTPQPGRLQIETTKRPPNGWEYRDSIRAKIRGFIRTVLAPLAQRWQAGEQGAVIRAEIADLGVVLLPKRPDDPRGYRKAEVLALLNTGEVR